MNSSSRIRIAADRPVRHAHHVDANMTDMMIDMMTDEMTDVIVAETIVTEMISGPGDKKTKKFL